MGVKIENWNTEPEQLHYSKYLLAYGILKFSSYITAYIYLFRVRSIEGLSVVI